MNALNILIVGNYDDLRGDSAIYLLERAPSGSCNVYFSGTTGSLSNPIITHQDGDFTASLIPLNWTETYDELIIKACDSASIDAIMLHALEGDWINYTTGSLYANSKGIPIFTQHYNDIPQSVNVSTFYGFSPAITSGWGDWSTGNSGSYGNELEFFDTVNDGENLTASVILYGDNKGLLQRAEDSVYINSQDVQINELNAIASVAAKYVKLVQVLSSSYVTNNQDANNEIYANYINNRSKFYYDVRQYFRQVSSEAVWTPTQGYGIIQIQNSTGSNSIMPDITSSINAFNLGAGTPLFINVISDSITGKYTFTWKNFCQSKYRSTTIKINERVVYTGTGETFTWLPDIDSSQVIVKFYTTLTNGVQSFPESNSIITLPAVKNLKTNYLRLNYGYDCANNGKYIAVSAVNINKFDSLFGAVDVLQYSKTTNKYEDSVIIKKLLSPQDFTLLLATESGSLDENDQPIGTLFITTELSSSYDVITPVILGAEQSGDTVTHQKLLTKPSNGKFLYVKDDLVAWDDNALDLEVESVFGLIDSYSDRFGESLALNGDLLAVGCPYFNVVFTTGDQFSGGGVDIYDLTTHDDTKPFYPLASIPSDIDVSFGEAVSFCKTVNGDLFLAVGSSTAFGNAGAVYIYKRGFTDTGEVDNTVWNLVQTIYGPALNAYFGGELKFDTTDNGLYTLVVGNLNTTDNGGQVYIYEKSSNSDVWEKIEILSADTTIQQTLAYLDNLSPQLVSNPCGGYGNSVSIYGDNLVIGAPTDTIYSEYVNGEIKYRGAVYFYQRCDTNKSQWKLKLKTWGDAETIVNNKFGFDVDIYADLAIVSVLKYDLNFTAKYIQKTLDKKINCNPNDAYFNTLGQTIIYEYKADTNNWGIKYTEEKLKEYGYPYLYYGFANALYDSTFVVGAPCFIPDVENLPVEYDLKIQGYAFIYNINNLIENHQIGNVFYRDGKMILSNSGSIFSGLMKDPVDSRFAKYDIKYKGELTLYEKQILCTINHGEFNYSTNPTSMANNKFFGFQDLDLMFKYLNQTIYGSGSVDWWNNLNFTEVEQSLFNYYTDSYDILAANITPYLPQLSSSYLAWDVDGNEKINLNDMTLTWKYFTDTLTQNDVFKHIEPQSKRKTLTEVTDYIKNNVIVKQYGTINPLFSGYDYSSSIDRTGSFLAPYITTIGLYSGTEIVGVAKLAHPIKNSGEFPLNILIKWDI